MQVESMTRVVLTSKHRKVIISLRRLTFPTLRPGSFSSQHFHHDLSSGISPSHVYSSTAVAQCSQGNAPADATAFLPPGVGSPPGALARLAAAGNDPADRFWTYPGAGGESIRKLSPRGIC